MCSQLAPESGMGWVLAKKGKQHNQGLGVQRGKVMCQGHTAKSAVEPGLVPGESAFSSPLAVMVWFSLLSLCSDLWSSHLWRTQDKPESDRELPAGL